MTQASTPDLVKAQLDQFRADFEAKRGLPLSVGRDTMAHHAGHLVKLLDPGRMPAT